MTNAEAITRICSCNKELPANTKITLSWSANIFLWFYSNILTDNIITIFLFQFPYILNQFSVLFTRFISKRTFMVIVTFFESIFTSTIVIFISNRINRCFVHKALNNIKFYKRTVTLIFDCFKPFYNWFSAVSLVHLCFFSDFIVNKFQIVFPNYSYFQLGRVNKSTFRIIFEIYFVIFKSDIGFALIELFYSIVGLKLICDGVCFSSLLMLMIANDFLYDFVILSCSNLL